MEEPEPGVELTTEPMYEFDRMLNWRKVKVDCRNTWELLITWKDVALGKAEWVAEADFEDLEELHNRIMKDRPREKMIKIPVQTSRQEDIEIQGRI